MKLLFLTSSALLLAATVVVTVAAPIDNDDVAVDESGVNRVDTAIASAIDEVADAGEDVKDDDEFVMQQLLRTLLEGQEVNSVTKTDKFLEFVVPLPGTKSNIVRGGDHDLNHQQLGNLYQNGLLSRRRRSTSPNRDGWGWNGSYTWGNGRYTVTPIIRFGSDTYVGVRFRMIF